MRAPPLGSLITSRGAEVSTSTPREVPVPLPARSVATTEAATLPSGRRASTDQVPSRATATERAPPFQVTFTRLQGLGPAREADPVAVGHGAGRRAWPARAPAAGCRP